MFSSRKRRATKIGSQEVGQKGRLSKLEVIFYVNQYHDIFTISPKMQSSQIDGLVSEGCVFSRKIAHLAHDGVLESGAPELSNEPLLDQIAQYF